MIQRMGRIIRPKHDKRSATFIVLYVAGTSEDPECGAHEAFLGEMRDNAQDVQNFAAQRDASALRSWCTQR